MILSLDISTSIIGICILDPLKQKAPENLQSLEFLNLKREKNLFAKALLFKEHIEKYKSLNITQVAIEEPLVRYKPGESRAQILSKLSMFNGMIAVVCYHTFNVEPKYYNVNTARKLALPNVKFPKGQDRKMVVWTNIAEMYPDVEWLYGPRSGKFVKTNFDMADAAIVGLAHSVILNSAV